MTTSFEDSPLWASHAVKTADSAYRKDIYPLEWWLTVAHQVAILGLSKDKFMGWVTDHYSSDENRFQASVAWDINKLGESSD